MTRTVAPDAGPRGWIARSLDVVERVGNRLPDPVVLFLLLMVAAWVVSWWLSGVGFTEIDPRTGQPLQIKNQLAGESLTSFMSKMVGTFTSFPPLGVVLVAMLGLGVAEHTGFISAGPLGVTLAGIVLLSGFVNLLVGSASAKWALIGAIMVPMLMQLGVSPDLTQAAYRVGDSSTNIITPLLPYSITLRVTWTALLLAFWGLGIPLGVGSTYGYILPHG